MPLGRVRGIWEWDLSFSVRAWLWLCRGTCGSDATWLWSQWSLRAVPESMQGLPSLPWDPLRQRKASPKLLVKESLLPRVGPAGERRGVRVLYTWRKRMPFAAVSLLLWRGQDSAFLSTPDKTEKKKKTLEFPVHWLGLSPGSVHRAPLLRLSMWHMEETWANPTLSSFLSFFFVKYISKDF